MKGIIAQEMFQCIPEIQFNIGSRYFLGNMDNYTKALLSTLKSIKSKLPLLNLMINSGEYEGLRTITQTLRKIFGNIGAIDLAEDTYQLELVLLNGDTILIQERLTSYISYMEEFSEKLELLLKKVDLKGSTNTSQDQTTFLHYDFTKTKESIKHSSDLLERKII